jgi:hypothetical protein
VRKLATADRVPQDQVSALEGVQQAPLREEVIGRGPPPAGSTPRSSSSCPAAAPRPSAPQLGLVVRRPEVLDVPRPPPRQVHELNRRPARLGLHRPAMRHSTRQLYGPSLVRKFGTYKEKNCRPAHRRISPGSNCDPTQVLQPPPGRSHGREPECALTAAKSGPTAVTRRTYGKALWPDNTQGGPRPATAVAVPLRHRERGIDVLHLGWPARPPRMANYPKTGQVVVKYTGEWPCTCDPYTRNSGT